MLTYSMEDRGGLPLYEYLYRRVREDILSGTLPAGTRLRSKRALEAEHGSCSPGDYLAIQDMAAACVRMFMDFALVVPLGHNECLHAMSLRPVHGDFEDDLIVAAAARVNADYLVSSDKRLRHHAPVACLTPQERALAQEIMGKQQPSR